MNVQQLLYEAAFSIMLVANHGVQHIQQQAHVYQSTSADVYQLINIRVHYYQYLHDMQSVHHPR